MNMPHSGHNNEKMKNSSTEPLQLEKELQVETALEHQLLQQPVFHEGLLWGIPRYGHPEGEIYKHIKEVYQNIDRLDIDSSTRQKLRIIAISHDTFKHKEDKKRPRDWSKHHGILARKFMENYIDDAVLLKIIELHDEAYYCWRLLHLYKDEKTGQERLNYLLEEMGEHIQLYYLFFKCDTKTGDKNPAPLKWFEKNIPGIKIVNF